MTPTTSGRRSRTRSPSSPESRRNALCFVPSANARKDASLVSWRALTVDVERAFEHPSRRRGARLHAELRKDAFEMLAHRLGPNPKDRADLGVGLAVGQPGQHLGLTPGQ